MKIINVKVGPLQTNCYLVFSEKSKQTMIIDPGDEPEKIIDVIEKNKLKPQFILNTHFHPDHLRGNDKLISKYNIPVYIGEKEYEYVQKWKDAVDLFCGFELSNKKFAKLIKENEKIRVDDLSFDVIVTPGHSPGGICLFGNGVVFTGDTLFAGDVGRMDLPGGSRDGIYSSFKRLIALPDDTIIYPGHGPSSTIREEKISNVLSSRI